MQAGLDTVKWCRLMVVCIGVGVGVYHEPVSTCAAVQLQRLVRELLSGVDLCIVK